MIKAIKLYNIKNEDNSPTSLNDKNKQALSKNFRQINSNT